jgi:hypothetical protein
MTRNEWFSIDRALLKRMLASTNRAERDSVYSLLGALWDHYRGNETNWWG